MTSADMKKVIFRMPPKEHEALQRHLVGRGTVQGFVYTAVTEKLALEKRGGSRERSSDNAA